MDRPRCAASRCAVELQCDRGRHSQDQARGEVDPPVCARPLVARMSSCDDPRTTAEEPCQKPSADVIVSPSALTARLPVKCAAMRLSAGHTLSSNAVAPGRFIAVTPWHDPRAFLAGSSLVSCPMHCSGVSKRRRTFWFWCIPQRRDERATAHLRLGSIFRRVRRARLFARWELAE